MGSVAGCVDQPLIPVERPASGGVSGEGNSGGNSTGGPRTGGTNNASGGLPGSGGNGPTGNSGGGQSIGGQGGCLSQVFAICGSNGATCCANLGLDCDGGSCCKILSQPCREGSQCCSGECNPTTGLCDNSAPSPCTAADYKTYCNGDGNCCSRNCDSSVCAEIEGCKPTGERCKDWWDCCSGKCVPQSDGGGRCQLDSAASCENAGEICENENAQDSCCAGLVCKRGVEGVKRCAQRNSVACASPPYACRVGSDCCAVDAGETSGHCMMNTIAPTAIDLAGKYYGTCSACGATGRACKVDVDCCVNLNFACDPGTHTCQSKAGI